MPLYSDEEMLTQIDAVITTDELPLHIPACYLFSQAPDSEKSVITAGVTLFRKNPLCPLIAISGELSKKYGYAGCPVWTRKLLESLPSNILITIPWDSNRFDTLNTFSEAIGLVEYARENEWDSVVIVAPRFHILRCFVSTVSALILHHPQLKVYAHAARRPQWFEKITHSQCRETATPLEFTVVERRKILNYKNLLRPPAILEYLRWREEQQ